MLWIFLPSMFLVQSNFKRELGREKIGKTRKIYQFLYEWVRKTITHCFLRVT